MDILINFNSFEKEYHNIPTINMLDFGFGDEYLLDDINYADMSDKGHGIGLGSGNGKICLKNGVGDGGGSGDGKGNNGGGDGNGSGNGKGNSDGSGLGSGSWKIFLDNITNITI